MQWDWFQMQMLAFVGSIKLIHLFFHWKDLGANQHLYPCCCSPHKQSKLCILQSWKFWFTRWFHVKIVLKNQLGFCPLVWLCRSWRKDKAGKIKSFNLDYNPHSCFILKTKPQGGKFWAGRRNIPVILAKVSQSFLLKLNLLSWKSRFSCQIAKSHFLTFWLPTSLVVTWKTFWIIKLKEITFNKHLKGIWWLDHNKKVEAVMESLAGVFLSRFLEWKRECVSILKILRLQNPGLVQFELANPLWFTKSCSYRKKA